MESTGTHHNQGMHANHNLTGFIIFLCSESVIFLAFFSGYALLKLNALDWLPHWVEGLEWQTPLINTFVLVSSSGTIYLAERRWPATMFGVFVVGGWQPWPLGAISSGGKRWNGAV